MFVDNRAAMRGGEHVIETSLEVDSLTLPSQEARDVFTARKSVMEWGECLCFVNTVDHHFGCRDGSRR